MEPSYEFLRLAVLVIVYLLFGAADGKMSAAGAPGTFVSSDSISSGRRGWSKSKQLLTCSSRFNANETPSFGVLGTSSRSRRKARRLSVRLNREMTTNNVTATTASSGFAADPALSGMHGDDTRSAFWLRNKCHDGFVVVKEKNRVLAQHEGIDKFSAEVKLVKESCVSGDPKTSSLMTRLYSPSQERYICFNRKGKVRAVEHMCAHSSLKSNLFSTCRRRSTIYNRLASGYHNIQPDMLT